MKTRYATILAVVLTSFTLGACATTSDISKLDAETLWQQGQEKLKAGKWMEATRLFERFTLEFPADTRYQAARFHIGEAFFGAEQYLTSAAEFARLATDYPAGPYADDSQMKVCESYYHLSPAIQLDQEYTQAAISQCQVLVAYFPASEFVARATQIMAEMTDKLAHKLYWTGDYYVRRRAHDAALVYYELAVKTYPTSSYAPRALQRMIDVYQELGYDTEEAATRARLLRDYPAAAAAADVEDGDRALRLHAADAEEPRRPRPGHPVQEVQRGRQPRSPCCRATSGRGPPPGPGRPWRRRWGPRTRFPSTRRWSRCSARCRHVPPRSSAGPRPGWR